MNNFEDLMRSKEDILINKDLEYISAKPTSKKQTADKSATLFDFIKMVDKLMLLIMPNVKFIPDEGKTITFDAMKKFDCPVITYTVLKRENKDELKPRIRETKFATENERACEIWGQKFKCSVQFNVFASVYTEAEEVMEKFEETIIKYAGFLKRNGVAEIFFKEHSSDSRYDALRESFSVRNLIYYVEIEKLTVMFKEKIKEIELLAQTQKDKDEEEN